VSAELALGSDPAALRAEVLRSVERKPDLGYGLYHLVSAWGQLACAIAVFLLMPEGWGYKLAFFFVMGWVQYRIYFLLHEACHFTLFPNTTANRVVGRVTSAMLFTSFSTFTWLHMEHHRLWGTRDDPGAVDYYIHFRSRFHALGFFLEPFLSLIVFEKISEHLLQPLKRFFIDRDDELRKRAREHARKLRPNPIADLFIGLGVQCAFFLALTRFGADPFAHLLFYMLPLGTVFLFLARLRMYLEHGPLDYAVSDYTGSNPRRIARTHVRRGLDGLLFQFMNFRFHQEHHIFPALPSCRLREVHERFIREHLDPDDLRPSYLQSLREIVRLPDGASSGHAAPPTGDGAPSR
jgi:fatty acid desaturase